MEGRRHLRPFPAAIDLLTVPVNRHGTLPTVSDCTEGAPRTSRLPSGWLRTFMITTLSALVIAPLSPSAYRDPFHRTVYRPEVYPKSNVSCPTRTLTALAAGPRGASSLNVQPMERAMGSFVDFAILERFTKTLCGATRRSSRVERAIGTIEALLILC
jgi:hypothetical protein